MKKMYIKPQMNTFAIKTQNLLDGTSKTFGVKGEAGNNTSVFSREGGSSWDDDDE